MAGGAKAPHKIKRVDRFAGNRGISAQLATPCLVAWLCALKQRTATVALDWTDLGRGRVMLCAAVAIAHRAVPVAWTVMGRSQFTRKRKSRNDAEEQMILRLKEAFAAHPWVLVADRGFARADLFAKLKEWDVGFVIRACGNPWVQVGQWAGRLWDLPHPSGQSRHYRNVLYHRGLRIPVDLVVTHREPAPEPWYLVTNLAQPAQVAACYRRRAWIEESFRDAKTHMGLKELRVKAAKRIERLLILMAIAMALAVLTGLEWMASHPAEDPQLTTHKKGRSLSIFRLGLTLLRLDGLPPDFWRFRLTPALEAV